MSEHKPVIRRANELDSNAIAALVARLVEFGPPPWRDAAGMVEIDRERALRSLRSNEDDPAVFVATCGDRIAGFVHVHGLVDQYHARPHGHVEDLVVAREFEQRGIARLLLEQAEEWATERGFEWLSLSVFERNARACRMYERAGFGRDLVRMVKPLGGSKKASSLPVDGDDEG